jgi:hypothetical protein
MLEAWIKVVSACYRERTFDPQEADVGIGELQCVWGKRGGGAKCPELGLGSFGMSGMTGMLNGVRLDRGGTA